MEKKEIDIVDLLILINNFFKRRKRILIISFLLGIIFGITNYFLVRQTYKTNLIINSSIINKSLLYQSFSPLMINLKIKNNDFLKKKLNLDDEIINQIVEFSVDTNISNSIRVNIELYDKNLFPKISSGFIYYLNNLNFVRGKISVERENLKKYISEVDSQLTNLKILQKEIDKKLQSTSSFPDNIGNLNETYVNIYEKRLELQKKFNETNSVFLYNDISQDFVPQNSLKKKLFYSILIFSVLGFLISLYLEMKNVIKSRTNTKPPPR